MHFNEEMVHTIDHMDMRSFQPSWNEDAPTEQGRGAPRRYVEHCLLGSIIEMQAFLVTLIRKFDISPTNYHPQIKMAKCGPLVSSLVLGKEYKRAQLPLRITVIRDT